LILGFGRWFSLSIKGRLSIVFAEKIEEGAPMDSGFLLASGPSSKVFEAGWVLNALIK
jgi:hypothetical protein